jgi:uncharacterized protein (DUF2141 family)
VRLQFGKSGPFCPVRIALLLAAYAAATAHAADLDIEVRGIKLRTGQVHAALFASADDFSLDLAFRGMISPQGDISTGVFTREDRMPRPPTETASAPADARMIHLHMFDVQPGSYALAVYHDVNDDGKLDTNLSGKPLEPWGMSNNPPAGDARPTFDDARFVLPPEGTRLIINLH